MARRSLSAAPARNRGAIPSRSRRAAETAGLSTTSTLDVISYGPKHRAHLRPVWDALPAELRGRWVERDARPPHFSRTRARPDHAVLVAGYLDLREARRLGYKRVAYLEHGIGQTYGTADPHLPGGDDRDLVGLFLSPNEHAASADRRRYSRARVEVVGAPRLDTLPVREGERGWVVAVSFHWHRATVPEMRSAFEHYRPILNVLAESFQIIGHAHPQATNVAAYWRRLVPMVTFVEDWDDVLRQADVFVADNTSALYEFAATGRPVVVLNAPEYRLDVEHGLRFWEAAGVGLNVWAPDELPRAIGDTLAYRDDFTARREAALDIVYANRTGAAARAAAAIAEWIQ